MGKYSLVFIGILLGIMLALGAGWWFYDRTYTYQGVIIDPPAAAPDFQLEDQFGNPYRLSEKRGRVVLIFFGYTHCPDVCPITLSEYKRVKTMLGERSNRVDFVFVSVDPERDTSERIRVYLENFDPAFIGLTGSVQVMEKVWKDYGVYQERQDSGSAAGYLVDHSARIYAIDRQGKWRLNYPFGMEAEKIALDIEYLLKGDE